METIRLSPQAGETASRWTLRASKAVLLVISILGCGSTRAGDADKLVLLENVTVKESEEIQQLVRSFWEAHLRGDSVSMRRRSSGDDPVSYFMSWRDDSLAMQIGVNEVRLTRLSRSLVNRDQIDVWLELPYRHCPDNPNRPDLSVLGLVMVKDRGWLISGVWSPSLECM